MPDRFDVAVVGGGVIGCSSAWWLEQAGFRVVVLERAATLGSLTTPNALGTIRTQYGSPALVDLAQESLAFYHSIEAHLGVAPEQLGWANHGYLYLTTDPDHRPRLAAALAEYEALGVTSSTLLDEAEIRARFPFAGASVAGIFHGDGSWVDPAAITAAWANACATTEFRTGVEVRSVMSGRVELQDGSSLEAEHIVVCAGPHAPELLSAVGVEVPVKITPRYRVFVPDSNPQHAEAPLVINIANGAYWRPVPGGVWLSTADVDERSVDPAEPIVAPEGFVARAVEQIEPVSPALAASARAAGADELKIVGGHQSYPADDVPIIGAVPGQPGVYMNVGHWAGVMLSPASGRLVRDCVLGTVGTPHACDIGRFAAGVAQRSSTNKFGGWG